MGCRYCIWLGSDDDGSDYPSESWPICSADMPVSNLKSFPFKKVPKQCKGTFGISGWNFPVIEREIIAEEILCDNLCIRSGLNYEAKKICRDKCEALRFIVGKTDISLKTCNVADLLEKMKFKNSFEFAEYETCLECNGKGIHPDRKTYYGPAICCECNGEGVKQLNIPEIKTKITTVTCKSCGKTDKIGPGRIREEKKKQILYCYECHRYHGIDNFEFVSSYKSNKGDENQ